MSTIVDKWIDHISRLYHTPAAKFISEEVARIEAQRDAYRADVEKEVTAHMVTIETLHARDRDVERLVGMLREVMACDDLIGWSGEEASPLCDRIGDELAKYTVSTVDAQRA